MSRNRSRHPRRSSRQPSERPVEAGDDPGQRKCIFCGVRSGDTREHIAPDSRLSDRHNWAKVVPCCSPCNHAKGDRLPTEAEFEAFERFWQLEVQRLRLAVAEMRLFDAQGQSERARRGQVRRENTMSKGSTESVQRGLEDAGAGRTVPDPRQAYRPPRSNRYRSRAPDTDRHETVLWDSEDKGNR